MAGKKNAIYTIVFIFAILGIISLLWILGHTPSFGTNDFWSHRRPGFPGRKRGGHGPEGGPDHHRVDLHDLSGIFAIITVSLITGSKFSSFLVAGDLALIPWSRTYPPRSDGCRPALVWQGWLPLWIRPGGKQHSRQFSVSTDTSAPAAANTWMLLSWKDRAISALGIVTGALAGLAAITPAAGFVTLLAAVPIGIVSAITGCCVMLLRHNTYSGSRKVDDWLDVLAWHGIGSTCWPLLPPGSTPSRPQSPRPG